MLACAAREDTSVHLVPLRPTLELGRAKAIKDWLLRAHHDPEASLGVACFSQGVTNCRDQQNRSLARSQVFLFFVVCVCFLWWGERGRGWGGGISTLCKN